MNGRKDGRESICRKDRLGMDRWKRGGGWVGGRMYGRRIGGGSIDGWTEGGSNIATFLTSLYG